MACRPAVGSNLPTSSRFIRPCPGGQGSEESDERRVTCDMRGSVAARTCHLSLVTCHSLFPNVLRQDRSGPAPGAKAALDQGPPAVEPGFLLDQGPDLGPAAP